MYDILQQIITKLWNSIKLFNGEEKRNLPENFRNIVIANKKIRNIDEIISYYHLPEQTAQKLSKLAKNIKLIYTNRIRSKRGAGWGTKQG